MATSRPARFLVAVVAVATLTACAAPTTGDAGFVGGDGSLTLIAPENRELAPSIEGETLEGERWRSASADGKVLVYNVWGSWCAPCRAEAPELVGAAAETAGSAVFVGINTRDLDRAAPLAFVRAFEVDYVTLYDPDARLLLRFAAQLPASAIPSTLVVDREGRVAARIIGETTRATLVGLVTDIAAGR